MNRKVAERKQANREVESKEGRSLKKEENWMSGQAT